MTAEHAGRLTTRVANGLRRRSQAPLIEFLCRPEDRGVIAEPVPARTVLPGWFRSLPATDAAHIGTGSRGITVKRCMPFLDALSLGWIIPLAATVRLEIKDGGAVVDAGWDLDRARGEQPRRLPGCRQPSGAPPTDEAPQPLDGADGARLELPVRARPEPIGSGRPSLQRRRRHETKIEAVVRHETPAEAEDRTRIHRNTQAGDGWYRANASPSWP